MKERNLDNWKKGAEQFIVDELSERLESMSADVNAGVAMAILTLRKYEADQCAS